MNDDLRGAHEAAHPPLLTEVEREAFGPLITLAEHERIVAARLAEQREQIAQALLNKPGLLRDRKEAARIVRDGAS